MDHLCCGNTGRASFLLEAGRRLQRPDVREAGMQQLAAALRRAERSGAYRVLGALTRGVYCPSLLHGTAGIGYEALRAAGHASALPAVLLLD